MSDISSSATSSNCAFPSDVEKSYTSSRTAFPVDDAPKPSKLRVRYWRLRHALREPLAEFLGTMVFLTFGIATNCQVILSMNPEISPFPMGDYTTLSFGWSIGVCLGLWVSAGISGGYINPAVTLAMATWRGFPWRKVPGYIFAQVMGGFTGAALAYGNYMHAIDVVEGGKGIRTMKTAPLFITFALEYMPSAACFFSEFLSTAVLLIVVLAFTDKRNYPVPSGMLPLAVMILIMGLAVAMGMETALSLNPARDLGPRLFASMVGYGKLVYTYRNHYWIWTPILGPVAGAQAGACLYDALVYSGNDSPIGKYNIIHN